MRINRLWIGKAFWALLIIGILLGGIYYSSPKKVAASEFASPDAGNNFISRTTTPLPNPTIVAKNASIEKTDYKKEFLEIVKNARDKRGCSVELIEHRFMSEIADKANALVYNYLKHPGDRLIPWDESDYRGSIYVVEGTSQINSTILESWVDNPREIHAFAYPMVSGFGLSIKSYEQYVIGVFIHFKSDIWDQDKRYIRLLPVYYEITHSMYPSIYASIGIR
jgi:hypothetical protein